MLTVWLPPAVDAKDLDPNLEHEKSVPTVEALLALNLNDSAVEQSFGVGTWPWPDVGNVSDLTVESIKFLPEIGFSNNEAFMIEVFIVPKIPTLCTVTNCSL